MLPPNQRIDSHVHFYTAQDLHRVAGSLPYALPEPHSLTNYLNKLIDHDVVPTLLNNVHLSILPDSENVFTSFEELEALQAKDPVRYGHIRLVGTIKADPEYATEARLAHPQVVGARIVLHDATPQSIDPAQFNDEHWMAFYARLLPHQHLHVYAQEAETNLRVLRQIPDSVRVIIDHFGSCHSERGPDEPAYLALLTEARRRGNVGFKGPGYRTSVNPEEVAGFVTQIIEWVGADNLLLEATDAPHVGTGNNGVRYARQFDALGTLRFIDAVAAHVCATTSIQVDVLLRGAARQLIG